MASKIKKALKKIGKAATIAGAGYLAMKGLKGKGTAFSRPKRGTIDQMAADAKMPGNLSRDMGIKRKEFMPGISDNMYDASAAKGGRIVKTKGGGKAVRGLGRAFTKRKK